MKISIRLKPDEAIALARILEAVLIRGELPDTRRDAIIYSLMLKFYRLLMQKIILIEKPIRLGVSVELAMSFCEFFTEIPVDRVTYAGHVINKTIAAFDQKTAGFFKD